MALIQCPECGKEISSSALSCPNCGYPLNSKRVIYSEEAKQLLSKITPINFKCPPVRLKVCIKCCSVFNRNNKPYCSCGMPGVEVDYPIQQGGYGDPGACLYIFEHDILPRNIGDPNSMEYQNEILQIQKCIRGVEKIGREKGDSDWRVRPEPPRIGFIGLPAGDIDIDDNIRNSAYSPLFETTGKIPDDSPYNILDTIIESFPKERNIPRCPICGSTSLTKISAAKKAAKIGFFGIFGAGDIGKTWKCNHCGSKF